MGPIAGGPLIGFLLMNKVAFAIGLPVGIGITLIHAWFSDRYLDPLIEAHQKRFAQGFGWWMVNIVAFAWALILSAFSMMIPWLILGDAVISNGR